MKDAHYFCLYLTENEHFIVEDQLRDLCIEHEWELVYYRQLKDGHWPCYREVKIKGDNNRYIKDLINKLYGDHIKPNPYKE
jgi:hypothetical protein